LRDLEGGLGPAAPQAWVCHHPSGALQLDTRKIALLKLEERQMV